MAPTNSTCANRAERSTSSSRDQRLFVYSLAAGVSALAGSSAADASVVWSGTQNIAVNQLNAQNLDLDGNGNGDVTLKNYVFSGGPYQGATVNFAPGKLVGFNNGLSYVTALSAGAAINSATAGPSFFGSMAYGANNPSAQFNDVTGAFIGLSFPAGAITRYGWVRVDVRNASGLMTIIDWGYETADGVGITAGAGIVPEPTSLSFLAAGAAGLTLMRRRAR